MGLYDDIAGAADHLAGSTDEAFARQFDDEEGGGIIEGISPEQATDINPFDESIVDEVFGGTTSAERDGDPHAGQTGLVEDTLDSIPRQFDDTAGGGFADELLEQAGDAVDEARNVGPEWLDELSVLVVVLLVVGAALWLVRPLLELGTAVAD